jgi:hypothetical protein
MLIIHPDSHLDRDLSVDHVAWLLQVCRHGVPASPNSAGILISTLRMPASLPLLPCGLYGPRMGDDPIADDDPRGVVMKCRFPRPYPSRVIAAPYRPSELLTVVALQAWADLGPRDSYEEMLSTAYGGPAVPREPGDETIASDIERETSEAFWAEHALGGVA